MRVCQCLHYGRAGIKAVRARSKTGKWGPDVYMTKELIERAGKLLNGGLSGPKVAAKLKCSTASVYAHWKQVSKGKFARKRKKP